MHESYTFQVYSVWAACDHEIDRKMHYDIMWHNSFKNSVGPTLVLYFL